MRLQWPWARRADYDGACREIRILEQNVREARLRSDMAERALQSLASPTHFSLPTAEVDEAAEVDARINYAADMLAKVRALSKPPAAL